MDPATIALIVQYALQYGIPAALEIIKLFKIANPTLADWEAAFAVAKTPYGLTPQTVGVLDLGVVAGLPTTPQPISGLPEFDVPPGTYVIVRLTRGTGPAVTICNSQAHCWYLPTGPQSVVKDPNGEIWTYGSLRWFILASVLA